MRRVEAAGAERASGLTGAAPHRRPVNTVSESESTLDEVEEALDELDATDGEPETEELRQARERLEAVSPETKAERERANELEARIDRRLDEQREKGAYDGGMGAALNPEEDEPAS